MKDYIPSRKSKCPCGSGKKFKDCCALTYETDRSAMAAINAFDEGRYEEALKICRADITRYSILHKKHTVPLQKDKERNQLAQMLVDIDIRALSELVELLLYCYDATNRIHKFHAVLNRLKNTIADPRWENRIVYYHALTTLGRDLDKNAAREVLKQLEPIDDLEDLEILQLYIDLNSYDLAFSKKNQIIDRIIKLSETPVDQLHYRGLKGVELFLIGDTMGSIIEVERAIMDFRKIRDDSLTTYESYILGISLNFLGLIKDDACFFEEAREFFQKALLNEDLRLTGKADCYRCIAETWAHQENWQKAKDNYLRSLDYDDNEVVRILMAECFSELDEISRAIECLESVEFNSLDPAAKADYAFISATIAMETPDAKRASQACELLISLELPSPYFRERRDKFLLALKDLENHKFTTSEALAIKSKFLNVIKFANLYFMIQPNIAGVGLDINKVITDLADIDKKSS